MYLVTVEDKDGFWWDTPENFNSLLEAKEYVKKIKEGKVYHSLLDLPDGHSVVVYSCTEINIGE